MKATYNLHHNTSWNTRLNHVVSGAIAHLDNLLNVAVTKLGASAEPHVWMHRSNTGATEWNAYDPVTNQHVSFLSADDLRSWLEERHYQPR